MKNKIKNLLENGLTVSTQHFYVDYHEEEGVFEIYGSRNLKVLQFWNTQAIREAAQTLIQIANEVDDLRRFSYGEKYFYVFPLADIKESIFYRCEDDYSRMVFDNIFKTREEAEKHKDEILAKFEEAGKKYVRD